MGNQGAKPVDDDGDPRGSMLILGLRDKMLRQMSDRDPEKFYDIVEVLGVGSMGSVSKAKKKESMMGGSARTSFVKSFRGGRVCYKLPLSCCFGGEPSKPKQGMLLTRETSSQSGSSNPKLFRKSSSMITYGHKETYYALKRIHLDRAANETYKEELKNEVEILKTLDHPNIVTPLETFDWKGQLCIVMELCAGGDLYSRDPYTEKEAARIITSILSAVAYMHSRNITHRDLKYENIMFLTNEPHADVKIIDFGLSKKYGSNEVLHDAVGTVYSMSPELLRGDYTSKSDVWSVGVLAFMLHSSSMPFYGRSRKHVLQKILRGTYTFKGRTWKYISSEAKEFVKQLLKYDPEERPTANEALQNNWLKTQNEYLPPEHAKKDVVQATVETFAGYGTLKKLALMVIAHKSTSEEVGFLRKMFQRYDADGNGELTLEEFKAALADYDYSDEEVETLFQGIDIDGSGVVHYSEFLAATIESHGSLDEERLAEAFDRMDCDDSGYISVQNLADLLGQDVKQSYLDSIIDEADLTRDHQISYEEFLELWNEDADMQRSERLENISSRRVTPENTVSFSSNRSSTGQKNFIEVWELSSEMSASEREDEGIISGDFLFKQEKSKSVRNFADI